VKFYEIFRWEFQAKNRRNFATIYSAKKPTAETGVIWCMPRAMSMTSLPAEVHSRGRCHICGTPNGRWALYGQSSRRFPAKGVCQHSRWTLYGVAQKSKPLLNQRSKPLAWSSLYVILDVVPWAICVLLI